MNSSKTIIGSKIIVLDEVNSTSLYLQDLIKNEEIVPDGLVVFSKAQLYGKGMGSNKWESERGKNIAMSFFIAPGFVNAADNFMICRFVALAVYDFINSIVKEDVTIKWPNDIYCGNKKIAGILIENNISGSTIKFSLVGIGININQEVFRSDAPNPISLSNITGKSYRIDSCLTKLCQFLTDRFSQLFNDGGKIQKSEYLKKLYGADKWLTFKSGNSNFEGKIKGVSQFGHLMVEERSGKVKEFEQKQIQFVLAD